MPCSRTLEGGVLLGGVCSGGSALEGSPPGGSPSRGGVETPPPESRRPLLRKVRILLECILVPNLEIDKQNLILTNLAIYFGNELVSVDYYIIQTLTTEAYSLTSQT